jgi:hypothetical protein
MKKLRLPLVVLLSSHFIHGKVVGCELMDQEVRDRIDQGSPGPNSHQHRKKSELSLFRHQLEFIYRNSNPKIKKQGEILQNFFENKSQRTSSSNENHQSVSLNGSNPGRYKNLKRLLQEHYRQNEQLRDNDLAVALEKRGNEREFKRKYEDEKNDLQKKMRLLDNQRILCRKQIQKIRGEQERGMSLDQLHKKRAELKAKLENLNLGEDAKKRRESEKNQRKAPYCSPFYQDLKYQLEMTERKIKEVEQNQKYFTERMRVIEKEIQEYDAEIDELEEQIQKITKKINYHAEEITKYDQLIKTTKQKTKENMETMEAANLAISLHALFKYLQYLNMENTLRNDQVLGKMDDFTSWCKSFFQDTLLLSLRSGDSVSLLKEMNQKWKDFKRVDGYLLDKKDKWHQRLHKSMDRLKSHNVYLKNHNAYRVLLPLHAVLLNQHSDHRLIIPSITVSYLCSSQSLNNEKVCEDILSGVHLKSAIDNPLLIQRIQNKRVHQQLVWKIAESQFTYYMITAAGGSEENTGKAHSSNKVIVKFIKYKNEEKERSQNRTNSNKGYLESVIRRLNLPEAFYPFLKYLTYANLYYALTHDGLGQRKPFLPEAFKNPVLCDSPMLQMVSLWPYYPLDLVFLTKMRKWEKKLRENHRDYLNQMTFSTYLLKEYKYL